MKLKGVYKELKSKSGSHSPSIETIIEKVGYNPVKIDACFLSNPYATDLFFQHLDELIADKSKFRRAIEFYPPQNKSIAKKISSVTKVDEKNIIVGNGAVEIIQMIIHKYVSTNICIPIPTFSPYYEYVQPNVETFYYTLKKDENFELNFDDFKKYILKNKIRNVVFINPNNPTGKISKKEDLLDFIEEFHHLENIIVDESFIDFSNHKSHDDVSVQNLVQDYKNLVVINSMSKNFGIAGLRCGYGVMAASKVENLLKTGYLWNISGLANFFYQEYENIEFQRSYFNVKERYQFETQEFFEKLITLNNENVKFYESQANFILMEILTGEKADDVMIELLDKYGVYSRECSDKIGLNGEFLRIASRNIDENRVILQSLMEYSKSSKKS